MANYYGKGRSNHFKVKDIERFKKIASHYELEVKDSSSVEGGLIVISTNDSGDYTQEIMLEHENLIDELKELGLEIEDYESETIVLPPFEIVISRELQEGEVFIWQSVGSEGNRYHTGYSFAVNTTGEILTNNIDDIYAKVLTTWKIEPTIAEY
jgi:hypothetical protein